MYKRSLKKACKDFTDEYKRQAQVGGEMFFTQGKKKNLFKNEADLMPGHLAQFWQVIWLKNISLLSCICVHVACE